MKFRATCRADLHGENTWCDLRDRTDGDRRGCDIDEILGADGIAVDIFAEGDRVSHLLIDFHEIIRVIVGNRHDRRRGGFTARDHIEGCIILKRNRQGVSGQVLDYRSAWNSKLKCPSTRRCHLHSQYGGARCRNSTNQDIRRTSIIKTGCSDSIYIDRLIESDRISQGIVEGDFVVGIPVIDRGNLRRGFVGNQVDATEYAIGTRRC